MCSDVPTADQKTFAASFGIHDIFVSVYIHILASLVAQMVKNLPTMQETQVQSLGQEDPLKKGMAPHASILAWRISWTEGVWRATVHRVVKRWIQPSN